MTKRSGVLGLGLVALMVAGLPATASASPARFAWFDYRGTDGAAPPPAHYRNPILAGFYPDPSIVRVGEDYYLVNSTFSWFPGIPVFHSRDLVHWKQIGNAIDRPTQLNFDGLTMSRGVYAPAISYHDGMFYIVNTCVDCGGNFIIKARNPAGPWSDPIWLKTVEGIDPSLFIDTDGSAWMINNRAPEGTPRYSGHRALWIERIDLKTLAMQGNPRMIVDGGADPTTNPVWIEGPHIYHKDGRYYLMAAEGGTEVRHSEVVFSAPAVDGPYKPAPASVNPILTQRDQPADRVDPISATGHADLVQLPDGRWWSIFLGTRPYAKDFYNIGRETYLLPVDWSGTWPVILPKGNAVPHIAKAPLPMTPGAAPTTGSFALRDEFAKARLGREWLSMRGPAAYEIAGGNLVLTPTRDGIGDQERPAFVARRQQHADAIVTTELRFAPGEGEMAGLAAIQNDAYFLTLALTRQDGKTFVRVARRSGSTDPRTGVVIADRPVPVSGAIRLRISMHGGTADFAYATTGRWTTIASGVDATNLSTATAGGFVGAVIGPFAQGAR